MPANRSSLPGGDCLPAIHYESRDCWRAICQVFHIAVTGRFIIQS